MKESLKALNVALFCVAGIAWAAVSAAILTDDSITEQFEHALKLGPYPKELPAGHSLVFNGAQYSSFGPGQSAPWDHGKADACEAVAWAWAMREYRLKKAREKRSPDYSEPPPAHWTLVTKPDTGNWCDATAK